MLARYDIALVKNIIAECYSYWHNYTKHDMNIFGQDTVHIFLVIAMINLNKF